MEELKERIAMTEIEDRIFTIAYENARQDTKYVKYIAEIIMLGREIMKSLGPHCWLFLEYEKLIGLSGGVYMKNVYQLGLKDGQELAK